MFGLVVRFDLKSAESAAAFDVLAAEAVSLIVEREPGTLVYATHEVEGEPLARVFYEVYADRAAFEAHEQAEHVQSFHARKDPHVAASRVEFLSPGPIKGL